MLGICEILDQQTCLRSYERFTSICRFEGGAKVSATTNWYWLEIPGECSLWSLKTIKGREMAEKVALSVVPTTPIRKDEVKSWGIFEQNVTVVTLTQITAFLNFLNEDFLC